MKIKGKAFVFGDNVNTDEIIPARYLYTSDPGELAKYCMEDLRPGFGSRDDINGGIFIAGGLGLSGYLLSLKVTDGYIGHPYLVLSAFFMIMLGLQSLLFGLTADMIVTLRKDIARVKCDK